MSACLADVRSLCAELERAIGALASNDLEKLTTGVVAQETLADKLHSWVQRYGPQTGRAGLKLVSGQEDVRQLTQLVRVYSGLLQRSTRSAKVRLALCRTYRPADGSTEKSGNSLAGRKWSCEV